jgi:dihydrofolate reductase
MRKIIVSEMVSVDGFFAGPQGEIDWHVVDEEFNQAAIGLLNTVDTILFGRITYQLFENFWPKAHTNPSLSASDLVIADKINEMDKIVFSKTLNKVEWKGTRLEKELIPERIAKLKQQAGKDIVMYGSGSLVPVITQHGLIDEYRFFVAPVILGNGRSIFKGLNYKLTLKLLEAKTFSSGNVLLRYQPK